MFVKVCLFKRGNVGNGAKKGRGLVFNARELVTTPTHNLRDMVIDFMTWSHVC